MTNVIEMMTSLYPVSDDTIQLLKDNVNEGLFSAWMNYIIIK